MRISVGDTVRMKGLGNRQVTEILGRSVRVCSTRDGRGRSILMPVDCIEENLSLPVDPAQVDALTAEYAPNPEI